MSSNHSAGFHDMDVRHWQVFSMPSTTPDQKTQMVLGVCKWATEKEWSTEQLQECLEAMLGPEWREYATKALKLVRQEA